MRLQIVAKNDTPLSPAIQDYATKRIEKMDRFLPGLDSGKVEITDEGVKTPDRRYTVQVTLNGNGLLIRAQEHADDARTAIDRVVEALANRMTRYKGRHYGKTKETVRTMEPAVQPLEPQGEAAPELRPKVVKVKQFVLKPMDIDEATDQMELLGHDFYLFINADTGKANLLYRRNDGDYGLIEPANL